jgi:transcriptional regulator with XRE-family HTH domain
MDLDIHAERLARGLSQKRLAASLGVDHADLSRWERGLRPFPERLRSRLAHVLGLTGALGSYYDPSGPGRDMRPRKAPPEWHASLRERRLAAGLTQDALAVGARLHRVTVAQYETGRARASLAVMQRIDASLAEPRLDTAEWATWHASLRERYLAAGLTRTALARRLFVAPTVIADYEAGRRGRLGLRAKRIIDGVITSALASRTPTR